MLMLTRTVPHTPPAPGHARVSPSLHVFVCRLSAAFGSQQSVALAQPAGLPAARARVPHAHRHGPQGEGGNPQPWQGARVGAEGLPCVKRWRQKCAWGAGSCSGSLGAKLGIPRLTATSLSFAVGPAGTACAARRDVTGGSGGRQRFPVRTSCRGPAPARGSLSLSASRGSCAAPAGEAAALPVRSYLRGFMNDSQGSAICL